MTALEERREALATRIAALTAKDTAIAQERIAIAREQEALTREEAAAVPRWPPLEETRSALREGIEATVDQATRAREAHERQREAITAALAPEVAEARRIEEALVALEPARAEVQAVLGRPWTDLELRWELTSPRVTQIKSACERFLTATDAAPGGSLHHARRVQERCGHLAEDDPVWHVPDPIVWLRGWARPALVEPDQVRGWLEEVRFLHTEINDIIATKTPREVETVTEPSRPARRTQKAASILSGGQA